MLEINKKETIYYSGFSMDPPETLELLVNFQGRITSDQNQKIIKLEEYKILSFWDKIEQIGVWNWSKKYPVKEPELEQLLDGYRWELKLRDRNGKAKAARPRYTGGGQIYCRADDTPDRRGPFQRRGRQVEGRVFKGGQGNAGRFTNRPP